MSGIAAKKRAADARLRREYGITLSEYDAIMRFQDGRCAICKRQPQGKRLAVDHRHKDGLLRGCLCWNCNRLLLGAFRDNVTLLQAAIDYLLNPPMTVYFKQERFTAPGRVGTKKRAKLLKLMQAGFLLSNALIAGRKRRSKGTHGQQPHPSKAKRV